MFDNVDIFVRRRRGSSVQSNEMHHMVQAILVKESVETTPRDIPTPATDLGELKSIDVLITTKDVAQLKSLMVNRVLKI